ncbi:MAG TPA: hypothetical protein VN083_04945 [Vicinamibacteria bacterium]|jgi:hypothetical protein|nr:hypothetical protein [Vicinamibacteria bacterium]
MHPVPQSHPDARVLLALPRKEDLVRDASSLLVVTGPLLPIRGGTVCVLPARKTPGAL